MPASETIPVACTAWEAGVVAFGQLGQLQGQYFWAAMLVVGAKFLHTWVDVVGWRIRFW